jgi:hypothetical protein
MSIKQNITSLQNLLEQVNALPDAGVAENLDAELNTQTTLLSEQDAKIAELAQVLAGKAGGGSCNLNVANITIDGRYGTTFRYVGADGLYTEYGGFDHSTIQVVIPSICFIGSANNRTSGFAAYNVSGGCSTIFNDNYCACVEIISSNANIIAVSNMDSGGAN